MTDYLFRSRLTNGDTLIGTMLTIPSPEIAELYAEIGFDWIFVDGEHGPFETADIARVLQAVGQRSKCLVRVPAIDEVPIKKALDLGAAGVIVPQVNSADDAKRIVSWCRYPPQGSRGIGLARAHGYGISKQEYLVDANNRVMVVVQAENRKAVENIQSIVQVSGVDCVLIGPNDLAASYGKLDVPDDPQVTNAIGEIEAACKSADMPLGIFGATAADVIPYRQRGFSLIVVGVDALLIGSAARELFDEMRK